MSANAQTVNDRLEELRVSIDYCADSGLFATDWEGTPGMVEICDDYASGGISAEAAMKALGLLEPIDWNKASDNADSVFAPIWEALRSAGIDDGVPATYRGLVRGVLKTKQTEFTEDDFRVR